MGKLQCRGECDSLFIGNLSNYATEEMVWHGFEGYSLNNVKIIRERLEGEDFGLSFLTFVFARAVHFLKHLTLHEPCSTRPCEPSTCAGCAAVDRPYFALRFAGRVKGFGFLKFTTPEDVRNLPPNVAELRMATTLS